MVGRNGDAQQGQLQSRNQREKSPLSIPCAPWIQKGSVSECAYLSGLLHLTEVNTYFAPTLCQGLCFLLSIQSRRIILTPKVNSQLSVEPTSSKMHVSQLQFDKGVKTIQWANNSLFNK